MKYLSILFLLLSFKAHAQLADTAYTTLGYELDYPSVHVKVDTVHHISQVYNYYHMNMYFAIDGHKAILLPKRGGVTTVWREHFTIVVTKRRYRGVFKI